MFKNNEEKWFWSIILKKIRLCYCILFEKEIASCPEVGNCLNELFMQSYKTVHVLLIFDIVHTVKLQE